MTPAHKKEKNMRLTRILLVLVFLAVAAVYTVQDIAGRITAADDPPVLTCSSEILEISVQDDDSILLSGVTAADPQDGDISGRVLVTGISRLMEGSTATVSYAVFDSDHNMATLTRRVRYTDYRLPRFALDAPLIYRNGEPAQLLDRLNATDVIDGDITNLIRVTHVNTGAEPGVYDLRVQATNSMGDTAWLTLPVILRDPAAEYVEVELDTYLVYLKRGDSFDARRYLNGATWKGDHVSLDNVRISSNVDTAVAGTYQVDYTCVYGSRSGTVILTVVVE